MKSNQDIYDIKLSKEDNKLIESLDTSTSSFFSHESPEAAEFFVPIKKNRRKW